MLYDQSQLTMAYLSAYQITDEPVFADAAEDVLEYVTTKITSPEGTYHDGHLAGRSPHRQFWCTITVQERSTALKMPTVWYHPTATRRWRARSTCGSTTRLSKPSGSRMARSSRTATGTCALVRASPVLFPLLIRYCAYHFVRLIQSVAGGERTSVGRHSRRAQAQEVSCACSASPWPNAHSRVCVCVNSVLAEKLTAEETALEFGFKVS